ncbi:hypothetical protein GGS23DRAFT_544844 [Durotheca rogersii]|uniref:uncharacterized protein n=1 Tax=Durotheca rogersii TaxID=419775 RepID=UPI00221FF1AB|nr:uncharacterized protein GGS23DRAFT_544844 [Durotheca rogersii]KAI5868297.1 hypothetical protein GGS23DRAFT_544844 [Durotheca rogersii]
MSSLTGDPMQFVVRWSDGQEFPEHRFPEEYKRDDSVTASWLSKLGEMIRDQMYPQSSRRGVLVEFPAHYHIRRRPRSGTSKRYDYYLYGYPDERADTTAAEAPQTRLPALKNFRSAAEFFDHLMFLLNGPQDRSGCQCKHCKPASESRAALLNARAPPPARVNPANSIFPRLGPANIATPQAGTVNTVHQPAVLQPVGPQPANPQTVARSPAATSSNAPTNRPPSDVRAQAQPVPSRTQSTMIIPTSAPGSLASIADTHRTPVNVLFPQPDEASVYRQGEVIWYTTDGRQFSLGLILRNTPADASTGSQSTSQIKPLSYWRRSLPEVEILESDMRPFFTFSVPGPQEDLTELVQRLMGPGPVTPEMISSEAGRERSLIVEASKVAASRVDKSYSLFNPGLNQYATSKHQSFGGVFLGAEKVSLYEAVRVRVDQPEFDNTRLGAVMIIKDIFLESAEQGDQLWFEGDVWILREVAAAEAQMFGPEDVTPAMKREKAFLNKLRQQHESYLVWEKVLHVARKPETFIQGRFYESEKVVPMVFKGNFDHFLQTGDVPSIRLHLNSRFDVPGDYIGRKNSRLDMLAGSIPDDTVLQFPPTLVEWPGAARRTPFPLEAATSHM